MFEITAGVAADTKLHVWGDCLFDLAFILDGGPLLRMLRIQGAAQLGASQVCDFDFVDVVGLYPALVLCISGLLYCVD